MNPAIDGVKLVRIGKSLRFLRIARSIRLFRIVKMQQVIHELLSSVTSEYMRTALEMAAVIVILIVLTHFIACGWYLVGSRDALSCSIWGPAICMYDCRLNKVSCFVCAGDRKAHALCASLVLDGVSLLRASMWSK